jgi:hypothetical protein
MSDLTREQVEAFINGGRIPLSNERILATQLLATMRENAALVAFVGDCVACHVECPQLDAPSFTCGSPECITAIVADYEGRTK